MDYLLQILFWCPRCWRSIGRLMFIAGTILALTGWRLSRRVERVEDRSGINIDLSQIVDAIPLPVPSTSGEFALTIGVAALGFVLARLGRWAERL